MKQENKFSRTKLARAISIASLPAFGGGFTLVHGQESPVIEQIVVTASRRESNIQDIPINISAVSGEMIEAQRLVGIAEIANYVPGLTVVDRGPRDEIPDVLVRGLNTTGLGPGFVSDTVATYLGEIPLSVDLKPVDLNRVEVLIGPQGTLYGQGTMGGAIRYIPNKADVTELTGEIRGDGGLNAESESMFYDYGVTINIPLISDVLALRANVDKIHDPGFIDYNYVVRESGVSNPEPDFTSPADVDANLRRVEDANGEDTIAARLNLRWLPVDSIDANLWYYYQDTEAEGRQITNRLSFGTGKYESGARYEEPNNYTNELISLEVSADFGFAEATAVYGHSNYEEEGQRDQTDLLLNFEYGYEFFPTFSSFTREEVDEESDTIELRMASTHDGPFSWVAGYFQNKVTSNAISLEFTPGFDQFAVDNFGGVQLRPDSIEYIQLTDQFVKESAFYGEISYELTDSFAVTLGYRDYEFETDIKGGFGVPLFDTVFLGEPQDSFNVDIGTNEGTDDGNLYKFNLSWDVTEDQMLYFTYSEGYRNGGVNSVPECTPEQIASGTQQLCALADEVFIDPDEIKNYEVGLKGLYFDGTLSTNIATYFIDWENLQVSTTTVNGSLPITGNGSKAESKGLEFQGHWLINGNWDASLTYAFTNAELTETAPGLVGPANALKGSRLPGHAENQASFNISYNTQVFSGVDLTINYGIVYSGDVFNIPGGDEDTLTETVLSDPTDPDSPLIDIPADRGGEAIPSYDIHHLSATFELDNWRAQAYVDNLWNEYYVIGTRTSRGFLQNESSGPGMLVDNFTLRTYAQYVGAPRNIGIRINYSF
jgi:outer membrane receptor protein involved in Fe transport